MNNTNISNFVAYCEKELELYNKLVVKKVTDPNETFYKSLPLCIIDAVFSIGVKYTSVMKAEENFISCFNHNIDRTYPLKNKEYTISVCVGAAVNFVLNLILRDAKNGNTIAISLLPLYVIMIIFLPCNNIVLSNPSTFMPFIIWNVVWIISKRYNLKNKKHKN